METPARKTVQALNYPRIQESQNFRIREPQVLLADEREAVERRPPEAEEDQVKRAVASATPEIQNDSTAERIAAGLVKENHGSLSLNLGMLDTEVECILVDRPLETLLRGLDDSLLRSHLVVELEENDLAHTTLRRPNREVPGVDVRVGIVVVTSLHQLLGRAAVADAGQVEDVLRFLYQLGERRGDVVECRRVLGLNRPRDRLDEVDA